jgi:uncharacterized protein (TIGR03435 family)
MRIVALLTVGLLLRAQPGFEVAAVKPNQGKFVPPAAGQGRFSVSGTLVNLISVAYGRDYQNAPISGGPKWVYEDRFDVDAKGPESATYFELRDMLQGLLAERFGLKLRFEKEEAAAFALVAARKDGVPGPNVVEVTGKPCASGREYIDPNAARCGFSLQPFAGARFLAGRMKHVAQTLTNPVFGLGRPVVDQTGWTGEYDIALDFALLQPDGKPVDLVAGPSLATALQEQLGLKLEPVRTFIDKIVVVSAEKPGEN